MAKWKKAPSDPEEEQAAADAPAPEQEAATGDGSFMDMLSSVEILGMDVPTAALLLPFLVLILFLLLVNARRRAEPPPRGETPRQDPNVR